MCYTACLAAFKNKFHNSLWVILFLKKMFQIALSPKWALPLLQITSHNYGKMNAIYSIRSDLEQK